MNATAPPEADAAAPLPTPRPFEAPAGWTAIDFLSDLHLNAGMPRTFAAWAAHLRHTPADAVFILGDLFDAWVGDDARQDTFEAGALAVLADAAGRRHVAFMAGNRDFLVGGTLLGELGVARLDDPTLLAAFGRRVLLTHGDALCLDDVAYQRFRAQVRDARWQAAVLTRPLAERRLMARQLRDGSDLYQHRKTDDPAPIGELDPAATARLAREADADVLVHGHTHRPETAEFAPGLVRHVLSDWDLDHDPRHARAEVLRLTRDGFTRVAPAAGPSAVRAPDDGHRTTTPPP